MKKIKVIMIILLIGILILAGLLIHLNQKTELKSITSKKQLEQIYKGENYSQNTFAKGMANIFCMPFSIFANMSQSTGRYYMNSGYGDIADTATKGVLIDSLEVTSSSPTISTTTTKDYSTTNIQVENVDEADIVKTDGNYIYSLSDNSVVITDVSNPEDIKVAAKFEIAGGVPEDLMLYQDKLVVISAKETSSRYYYYNNNTVVDVFDITDRTKPLKLKTYTLYEPYYTSRCIDNKLYVIASGKLRKENNEIITYYHEDNNQKNIELKNIKYLTDMKTSTQTIISMLDLNNPEDDVKINPYLIDISNAYVSEKNIYLLSGEYKYRSYYNNRPQIKDLFTLKGIFGLFDYNREDETDTSNYKTTVYKFNMLDDGSIRYDAKVKENGQTINQFSVDEYQDNLRLALYDNNGSKVVVFNKKLEKIGETSYLAKGEKMYSSRFMGERAYLVTYRTMDPLYVIDLKSPSNPKVLGELKIPGYSTYLHPYDENHLIGIGMETKETVNRDTLGRVRSTSARVVGMKMALFDVSNVKNPIQISSTIIGDSRATSAILTNHKALLFSKEKELIAIPVNNYAQDFEVSSADDYSSLINYYTSYSKRYISEGYFVYKINVQDGFSLKGIINHDKTSSKYTYWNNSRLLRGLYINDDLFTVSEDYIKVNRLDNLDMISQLNVRTGNAVKKTDIAVTETTQEKNTENTLTTNQGVSNSITSVNNLVENKGE